jgi:hypothetical protein
LPLFLATKKKLNVKRTVVKIYPGKEVGYSSLTEILKAREGDFLISEWLTNRNTVEFPVIWESVNNPDFNYDVFATIRSQAGLNNCKISVKE